MDLNRTRCFEQETVALAAAWELIDSMVNYKIFVKFEQPSDVNLRFVDMNGRDIFLIFLVDFLSTPGRGLIHFESPEEFQIDINNYLDLLNNIEHSSIFLGDTGLVKKTVDEFYAWLNFDCVIPKIWIPSIEYEGEFTISRIELLRISGNIQKHNFTRLDSIAKKVRRILRRHGRDISEKEAYLTFPDLNEWFSENIILYHATTIAYYLNEIRWGIYKYLREEFSRSYCVTERNRGLEIYEFNVPKEITDPVIQTIYWNLMNSVRHVPYFERFSVDPYLQKRY